MRAAELVLVGAAAVLVGCALLPGYDFDGFRLEGGSGGATCAPTDDHSDDGENCGACGHSCLGGACRAGRCEPVQLFVAKEHTRADCAGTLGPLLVAERTGLPSTLFFADIGDQGTPSSTGCLWRIDADATHVSLLVDGGRTEPVSLTRSLTAQLYWTDLEGRVSSISTAGGHIARLVEALPTSLQGVATSGNHLYYVSGSDIVDRALTTGAETPVSSGEVAPFALGLDASGTLYATTIGTRTHDGLVLGFANQTRTVLAMDQAEPDAVLADADGFVYYVAGDGLWRVPADGSASPEQLAPPETNPDWNAHALAADADFIYWTSWGTCLDFPTCTNGEPLRGRVHRARRDGTEHEALWTGDSLATGIAVDGAAVYWTTWFSGGVLKLAK